jgi:peptidoglycan/LPS O-acetylase OafA/YrhL
MSVEPDQIAAVSTSNVDATKAAKTSSKPPARFAFVDSLRGLAAVSIMIFHIWWYEPAPFVAISNRLVNDALLRTRGGVQILLVISGFVIAYTLRHVWGTWKETLLFLGRRLVRLVPAYWAAIAIAMLTDYSCRYFWDLPSAVDGHHSVSRTLAHMTFLQDIFDYDALSLSSAGVSHSDCFLAPTRPNRGRQQPAYW